MYPFERFSERAKEVLTLAQDEAQKSHHSHIGTEHILIGLLREGDGLAAKVLASLGVEMDKVRSTIESVLGRNERVIVQQTVPTSRVKKVIEIAFEEAKRMNNTYVGTEHLLLGLLIEGEGLAARVVEELGATLERVRLKIAELGPEGKEAKAEPNPRPYRSGPRWPSGLEAQLPGWPPVNPLSPHPGPRLTAEARSVITLAEEECLRLGTVAVGTVHLLLGILRQEDCQGASALAQAGLVLERVRTEVGTESVGGEHPLELGWAPAARTALEEAAAAAGGLPVGTGAILAACLRDQGGAAAVLRRLGADLERVRAWLASGGSGGSPPPA